MYFKLYIIENVKIKIMIFLILPIYFHYTQPISLTNSNETPSFDDVYPRNLTVVIDDTAILKCKVKNKGNRTVSWIRKRDLHILTTNIYTYTGDQRFSVVHPSGSDNWDLKINYVQSRDSGIYECQVNTEPKINLALTLFVTGVRAKILGSGELHVKKESTIAITCTVNIHSSSVIWYHESSIVDFDSSRGGISLETEKTELGTTSKLMMTRATLQDSGNYTCYPMGALPASIRVHVLTGEQPAAMQTSGTMSLNSHSIDFISCSNRLLSLFNRAITYFDLNWLVYVKES